MKKSILLVFLFCFLLSGCTGYREIERGYFVTAIAFSKSGESVSVLVEALFSSDVTNEKSERVVLKCVGNSEKDAFESLENTLVKPLYLEHLGAILLENELAENIVFLKQINGINGGAYVVKTSDATALFKNDSPSGILGYDIVNLIKKQNKKNSTKITLYNADNPRLPTVDFKEETFILQWNG